MIRFIFKIRSPSIVVEIKIFVEIVLKRNNYKTNFLPTLFCLKRLFNIVYKYYSEGIAIEGMGIFKTPTISNQIYCT